MKRFLFVALAAALSLVACERYDYAYPPFRVEWASCNLGAAVPEDPGTYFAWGETAGKDYYGWDNYRFGGPEEGLSKYNPQMDRLVLLEKEDDAAAALLGDGWRLPTKADWEELVSKGVWKMEVRNGKAGYRVTSRADGEEIVFLPAGGLWVDGALRGGAPEIFAREDGTLSWRGATCHFWTSELSKDNCFNAWYYGLADQGFGQYYTASRSFGLNIRPVRDK